MRARSMSAFAVASVLGAAVVSNVAVAGAAAPATAFPAAGELMVRRAAVRAAPTVEARTVRVLRQFRPDFHPEIVLALESRADANGLVWYRISLPGRPNGRRGWIRADLVDVRPMANRIIIRRRARVLEVRRISDDTLRFRARIAVGKPSAQTPLGSNFYVRAHFVPANSFLGVFALETSAYAPLSDWPGPGVVGIHGTSAPWSIGRAVSHGCVRLLNRDVVKLKYLAPVGTPIDVVP